MFVFQTIFFGSISSEDGKTGKQVGQSSTSFSILHKAALGYKVENSPFIVVCRGSGVTPSKRTEPGSYRCETFSPLTSLNFAAPTTDQNKSLVWRHSHRDDWLLPRILIKVEGDLSIADHSLPAARHSRAEGGVHGTCKTR